MKRISHRAIKLLSIIIAVPIVLLLLYHCPFKRLFGVPCPGCGMTRALFAGVLSSLKLAFYYHPLVPFLLPISLYVGLRLFGGMRVSPRNEAIYIVVLFLFFLITYIARMLAGDPVLCG